MKQNVDGIRVDENSPASFAQYRELLELRQLLDQPSKLPESPRPDKLYSSYFRQVHFNLKEHAERRKQDQAKEMERIAKKIEREKIEKLIETRKAPISDVDQDKIRKVLNGPATHDVIIDKFNIDMTRAKIVCLRPRTWLNDEVMNFYMAMLLDRDQKLVEQSKSQKVESSSSGQPAVVPRRPSYFFNSFFVSKLMENGYDYAKVKRWTKKFDVFEQDKIFFPVNLSNTHWTMAVVFVQKKEIHYYDSMSGAGRSQLNALLNWIVDEAKEKKSMTIDRSEWILRGGHQLTTPQQENGFDCGMFSICCASYLADDLPLEYEQSEMPENRMKVGAAILNGGLPY
jgi:sentrin-specific protease 1